LVPISTEESINIGMGMAADWLKAALGSTLPAIATGVLCLSALITLLVSLGQPRWAQHKAMQELFNVAPLWLVTRIIGAIFAVMTFFHIGPEFINFDFTGGVILNYLAPVLVTFFFFAAILLPFLVDFGFMEFVGSLV